MKGRMLASIPVVAAFIAFAIVLAALAGNREPRARRGAASRCPFAEAMSRSRVENAIVSNSPSC
jgi:hypothetical protein